MMIYPHWCSDDLSRDNVLSRSEIMVEGREMRYSFLYQSLLRKTEMNRKVVE